MDYSCIEFKYSKGKFTICRPYVTEKLVIRHESANKTIKRYCNSSKKCNQTLNDLVDILISKSNESYDNKDQLIFKKLQNLITQQLSKVA